VRKRIVAAFCQAEELPAGTMPASVAPFAPFARALIGNNQAFPTARSSFVGPAQASKEPAVTSTRPLLFDSHAHLVADDQVRYARCIGYSRHSRAL